VDPHRGRLQIRKAFFRDYRGDPAILGPTGGTAPRSRGETCSTSPAGLPESGCGRPRSSKVAEVVYKVSGPTCRSAGLLTDWVHLPGTFGTLVGGDPWVPMSLIY
jgi:hypothetical protein